MRARLRLPNDVLFCLGAFLIGRLVVSVLAIIGWQLPHDLAEPGTLWEPQPPSRPWYAAFTGLEHFDASWYLQLASHGYLEDDPSSAYFPLYPLLVHVVGVLCGGRWLLAAYVVGHAALLVALVLLYRLTTSELSESVARWTVVLLVASPMALFLYAPYSEPLFLALSLACLTWLRRGRWACAAGAAALATATRSTGAVLAAAMAAQAFHDAGWSLRPSRLLILVPRLAWSAAGLLGTVMYLLYWEVRDSWRVPFDVQGTAFQREAAWPWDSLVGGWRYVAQNFDNPGSLIRNIEVLLVCVAIALGVVVARRYAAPYVALTLCSLVLPLTLARPFAPLTSVPRYYLVVFPLFWALAEVSRRPLIRGLVLTISGSLLGLLTLLFASWHDVL